MALDGGFQEYLRTKIGRRRNAAQPILEADSRTTSQRTCSSLSEGRISSQARNRKTQAKFGGNFNLIAPVPASRWTDRFFQPRLQRDSHCAHEEVACGWRRSFRTRA